VRHEGRDWIFAEGQYRLWQYVQFPHVTHVKIIGEANPHDPAWDGYLAARLGQKMAQSLFGRRKLLWLWKQQNGTCPHCGQRITKQTPWDVHHKVKRTDGGSDKLTNLELLHRLCHKKLHAIEPKAVKKPKGG
jgi:RNA-directed DNA polymerase